VLAFTAGVSAVVRDAWADDGEAGAWGAGVKDGTADSASPSAESDDGLFGWPISSAGNGTDRWPRAAPAVS
jgi:hypothetical protein